jgi:hypothetical protein
MLFMAIFTYEPGQRNEAVKRRLQGRAIPEGVKLIGEWTELAGGRTFRVVDMPDDAKLGLAGVLPWSDIGKMEYIPIIDTEVAVKLAAQSQK